MADRVPPRSMSARSAGVVAVVCAAAGVFLAPREGRVLQTYPDAVYGWKRPTACDGHTGPELRPGQTFTPAECDEMRNADLRKTYTQLAPCFGVAPMSDHEIEAYLSLAYNAGAGAVCRSTIPAKVKAGRHDEACAAITSFVYVGSRDCRDPMNRCVGVVRRRAAERALCEAPDPAAAVPLIPAA